MSKRIDEFHKLAPDYALYELYFRKANSKQKIALQIVRMLWEGKKLYQACKLLKCDPSSARRWLDVYIDGGFKLLMDSFTANQNN